MPKELVAGSFCQSFLVTANRMANLAPYFLWAALGLAILAAVMAVLKPSTKSVRAAGATSLETLIAALKGLIESLSAAPAWLGLLAAGLLIFWISNNNLDPCSNYADSNLQAIETQNPDAGTSNPAPGSTSRTISTRQNAETAAENDSATTPAQHSN